MRRRALWVAALAMLAVPTRDGAAQQAPGRDTLKSRLGDKASDAQRVDDCKVPPERRGASRRPSACGGKSGNGGARR